MGDALERRLLQSQGFEHLDPFFIVHLGQFGLDLGADRYGLAPLALGVLTDLAAHVALAPQVILIDVHHVQHALAGNEAQLFQLLLLVGVVDLHGPGGLSLRQDRQDLLQDLVAGDILGLAALGRAFRLADRPLHRLQVRQDQFRVDDLDVAHRIDTARDVQDVFTPRRFREAPHHLHDRVHLADVA